MIGALVSQSRLAAYFAVTKLGLQRLALSAHHPLRFDPQKLERCKAWLDLQESIALRHEPFSPPNSLHTLSLGASPILLRRQMPPCLNPPRPWLRWADAVR